jgi:hypothetical protein
VEERNYKFAVTVQKEKSQDLVNVVNSTIKVKYFCNYFTVRPKKSQKFNLHNRTAITPRGNNVDIFYPITLTAIYISH